MSPTSLLSDINIKSLKTKDCIDTYKSASYLDLHLETNKGGRLKNNSAANATISLFK
jgi:hypothetical protein